MTKLLWTTDTHLDFLEVSGPAGAPSVIDNFIRPLSTKECDGIIFSGDISTSIYLSGHLKMLDSLIKCPIYFVLGNHDFYGSDFRTVRQEVKSVVSKSKNLRYLTNSGIVSLTSKTAIIGHDGWYDAYYGRLENIPYVMSDWFRINDFVSAGATVPIDSSPGNYNFNVDKAISVSRKAAAEAATYIEEQAKVAARNHDYVVIVTHVPPFPVLSDSTRKTTEALPWYSSRLMGDTLNRLSSRFPNVRFEVFCGHVHDSVNIKVADNLYCHVGPSEYGNPMISGYVSIP